jgi:hypothetical protein
VSDEFPRATPDISESPGPSPPERGASGEAAAPEPDRAYRERRDAFAREAADLAVRSGRVTAGRLASFLALAAALAGAIVGSASPRPAWLAAAGVLLAVFAALVVLDGRLSRRRRRADALREVNERALARRRRDWKTLEPTAGRSEAPRFTGDSDDSLAGGLARDLGLFGHASLDRLLDTTATPAGRRRLARWLEVPAPPAEIARRQEAVRALAPALDWRQRLESGGRLAGSGALDAGDLEGFYGWAESDPWLLRRPALLWLARLLTVLVLPSFLAWIAGYLGSSPWVLLALAAYLLSARFAKPMNEAFDRATAGGDGLRGYGELFRHLESLPGGGALLDELRGRLAAEERSAAFWMDRLERLTVLADVRHGLIHFFLQVGLLWDFHLLARFEAWQRRAGGAARGWLEALGEVEALAGLAELAHAQPDWAFPEVREAAEAAGALLESRELGHPLLADAVRVGNDITLGPPGTFLLVTGSNMSGKTTLLRAVGANVVLAQAGAPVCARRLVLPPLELATSVVVEDSLEGGVSFFMAELLRLKQVVDTARRPPPGRSVLYLLDEVLRGTNSAERQVAVRRVLEELLALGAIGAVTTHDLEILGQPGAAEAAARHLAEAARPIHFRETVHPKPGGGAEMSFDYRARPGLAPTRNALRLLEAVGLGGEAPRGLAGSEGETS